MVRTIDANRVASLQDGNESFSIVDTRDPESFRAWHLQGAVNVPYDPRNSVDYSDLDGIAAAEGDRPLVVVCAKGLTSTSFAFELESYGYSDVAVLKGGMEAWSHVYESVPVETNAESLAIRQVQRRGKGCLGYVVASPEAGTAAVVDPTRDDEQYQVVAGELGCTVSRVFDTHVHADHLSGGRRMADRLGVPYHLGARARDRGVEYEYEPLDDGETVGVGDVEIRAIHAPGHTSEMTTFQVADEAILTGDTLFVDSVGRTELQFGDASAERGARALHETIHERLLDVGDDLLVLPGHVGVTADGRFETGSVGAPVAASVGALRRLDLLELDEEAFVDSITDDTPSKPPNYETVIACNRGKRAIEDLRDPTGLELGPNNCAA